MSSARCSGRGDKGFVLSKKRLGEVERVNGLPAASGDRLGGEAEKGAPEAGDNERGERLKSLDDEAIGRGEPVMLAGIPLGSVGVRGTWAEDNTQLRVGTRSRTGS